MTQGGTGVTQGGTGVTQGGTGVTLMTPTGLPILVEIGAANAMLDKIDGVLWQRLHVQQIINQKPNGVQQNYFIKAFIRDVRALAQHQMCRDQNTSLIQMLRRFDYYV